MLSELGARMNPRHFKAALNYGVRFLSSCLRLVEVAPDGLGGFAGHDGCEGVGCGLLNISQAAEVRE